MPSQCLVCPEGAISRRIHLWEGKNAFNRPCESSNASPDCCGQVPWILVALWGRADVVTAGTFLGCVCPVVGCPSWNSRSPGLGWCRRSIGERRLFSLSCTIVQGCWMLPRSPGSRRQGMLYCNPSWRAGNWSHQCTGWGVGTSGWSQEWVASVEVCRRWRSYNLRRLRTTTQSLIGLETDRAVTIPTARGQTWSRPWFLLRIDPASEKLGITSLSAVVQWVSCRTMMKALFL